MVFVSMLAVGLLCCFGSCIVNVRNNYQSFVKDYQDVDELVSTEFSLRKDLLSVSDVEGVNKTDARIVIDCYLRKPSEDKSNKAKLARVFSFNEETNTIFKRAVIKEVAPSTTYVNISLSEKFARNNNYEVGETLELGFLETYMEFYVNEIVNTPEGIYPRANNYIWSDNYDFGYIYVSEQELGRGLKQLATTILNKVEEDPTFKEYYNRAMEITGINIPDLIEARDDDEFVKKFANQLMVKNNDGQNRDEMLIKINDYLNNQGVKVKSSLVGNYQPHIVYMDHALEQVQIASIFLPVFFYTITMIVVGLFINQIIKTMTPQIGVFMSIGVDNNTIVGLFMIYTIIMGLTAGLLGVPVGYGINIMMTKVMKATYCIPSITAGLHPLVTIGAIIGLLLFVVLTTLIATRAIFRITPKDATISNEAKRKQLPKFLSNFIDKAPMNIKLGTNSIAQNPRRFFVSSFSIFASLVLIILSSFFYVSKNEMIDQSVNRRLNYDCQIYLTEKEDDEDFILGLKEYAPQEDEFEECYYTYLKVDVEGKNDAYLECLAVNQGVSKLINIPSSSGKGDLNIPEKGVILPKSSADSLKVKKGDTISINNVKIPVVDISYQYFHPITYLSKAQMDELGVTYVSSYIMNVNNTTELLKYLSANRTQCLTVFTSSLSKDLHNVFDSTDIMIGIMIAFSLGMAFIILCIMSQNALMEQQRQLTIFRAIGFTVLDISNVWTLQSAAQLFASALVGVPMGALSIYILLRLCSSASQTYPFVFSWPATFIAIGFVLTVVITCHLIAMRSIYKWNIADNTRSRE